VSLIWTRCKESVESGGSLRVTPYAESSESTFLLRTSTAQCHVPSGHEGTVATPALSSLGSTRSDGATDGVSLWGRTLT